MHCERKLGKRLKIWWLGGVERGMALFMAGMLVFTWSCSGGEDKQPPEEKNKVVVAIKRPMPKPAPEEKVEPPPVPQKQPEPAVEETKKTSQEEERAAKEEQPTPEAVAATKKGPAETQATAEPMKKPERQKQKGFVRVRKGESLSAVAARADVYGDFLKWPRLYELNRERLPMIQTWDEVKKMPLPSRLSLRYAVSTEEQDEQALFQGQPWVVTVRSWQTPGRLTAPAIKLMKNGFHIYIARAVVKEKQWLRLRVGFFRSKSEALAAKEKISEILGSNDAWIARVGKAECEEFGRN